jgi:hypothetical protein
MEDSHIEFCREKTKLWSSHAGSDLEGAAFIPKF